MGFIKYRNSPTGEWQEIYSIKGDTPVKGVDYFTEEEINGIINDITDNIVGEQVDLGNYYTKTEIDDILDELVVEVDLTDYYTKTEADNIIQEALGNYYSKTEIDTKLANIETGDVDLTDYYTKAQTDTKISDGLKGYATENYVDQKVANTKPDLTNYYTKTQTDTQITNKVEAIFSYNPSTGRLDITI